METIRSVKRPGIHVLAFLLIPVLSVLVSVTFSRLAFAEETLVDEPMLAMEKDTDGMLVAKDDKSGKKPPDKPCKDGDPPVICVGVDVQGVNELGCNSGKQCSLSTQNKPCGGAGAGTTCQTEVYPEGSTTCRCKCK